jgi:hypothetical protein
MKRPFLNAILLLMSAAALGRAQDLEASYQSLKDADAKGDTPAVKKLAAETSALARKAAAEAAPADADEKDGWSKRVAYAKDIDGQTEYILYATALKSPPPVMVDLLATLEAQNPKCKYLDLGYASYLYALSQTGGASKIPAIAEKALDNFPENTDLLLVMANQSLSIKQSDKALGYADRLVAAYEKKTKPEGMSDADWDKQRNASLGRGYWVAGVVSAEKNQYAAADKNLRAALPMIKGNNAMMSPALFYLGLANYNLGKASSSKAKVLEGAKFSDQCAAIPGELSTPAAKNATAMKADAAKLK